jgi:hypothetical protein
LKATAMTPPLVRDRLKTCRSKVEDRTLRATHQPMDGSAV